VLENVVVAVLSSPSLQLQLNQIDSEITLTNQRSEGLNISLNQIRPNQEQAETLASRLIIHGWVHPLLYRSLVVVILVGSFGPAA